MKVSNEDPGLCTIASMAVILMAVFITANTFFVPVDAEETATDGSGPTTTWTGEITVSGEYAVKEHEILIIEPGASIKFDMNARLAVHGTLKAEGSLYEDIDLTGYLSTGSLLQPDFCIIFSGEAADKSRMDHCSLHGLGIRIVEASPTISNSRITNNSVIEISGFCSPVIDNNVIRDNGIGTPSEPWYHPRYSTEPISFSSGRALDISCGTTAVISNNEIVHNGGFGINIASASPVVFNNTIKENRHGGILIEHCWWDYDSAPVLRNNIIQDHGNSLESSAPPEGTEIYPSRRFNMGIMIDNADCYFFDNTIQDNDIGVSVSQDLTGVPKFNKDSMVNNTIGVYSYCGSPVLQDCCLDNHAYDFWVEVYSHVKAYNTTFDENKIMILGESSLETEYNIYYPVASGLGILGFLLLMFFAVTETGKYRFFSVFFPLYSRLKRHEILDQFVRGQIYGLVRGQPGIHYSKIKRVLSLGNGTLAHHLAVLEREGFVYSKQHRLRKLFYPADLPADAADQALQASSEEGIELSDVQERIIGCIKDNRGITQTEIASKLDIPKQTVSYNIKSLSRMGFVEQEKNGNRIRCYYREHC